MTLNDIALKYGTDKSSAHHNYCDIYEWYFKPLKNEALKIVEIGIGGYEYPDRGGESLKMWRQYFSNALIVGTDIYPKNNIPGVEIRQISQVDPLMVDICQGADIIIDDASHVNKLTIESFELLFPTLVPGGIYVVEDVHTSYFPSDGYGGSHDLSAEGTTMNYFKCLTDQLNQEHLLSEDINPLAEDIEFIHFYKEIIFIKKRHDNFREVWQKRKFR